MLKLRRALGELIAAHRAAATHMVPVYAFNLRNALDIAISLRGSATDEERAELADIEPRARKLLSSPAPTPAAPRQQSDDEINGPGDLRIDWDQVGDFVEQLTPGAGRVITQATQLPRDVAESILRSPLHAQTVFAEHWESMKEHWLEWAQATAALVAAEVGVVILLAVPDPSMGTKMAAFAFQALLIALAVHAAYTVGSEVIALANSWWAKVSVANGDLRKIDAASLDFTRMMFLFVETIVAAIGFKALSKWIGPKMGPEPAGAPRTKPSEPSKTHGTSSKPATSNSKTSEITPAKKVHAPKNSGTQTPTVIEYHVELTQLHVEVHRSATRWSFDLNAPLPGGRRHTVAEGYVKVDVHGAPLHGPKFTIDKTAFVDGVEGKVQIYKGGRKLSATDVALDEAVTAFKKEFGHSPDTLPGSLAWENKRNFQVAYAKATRDGLTHDAASQRAIREISFGRSRAARGYDRFTIEATDFIEVDLGALGTRRVPDEITITARRSKQ